MRALVVDDDPASRRALEQRLLNSFEVEKVDSAKDSVEALDRIEAETYDFLLIDIQKMEPTGIELATSLKRRGRPGPPLVFLSSFESSESAGPYSSLRGIQSVTSQLVYADVSNTLNKSRSSSAHKVQHALLGLEPFLLKRSKIAVKDKGRIILIDPTSVMYVQAQGNYVLLHRAGGSYLLREPISAASEKLGPYGFVRIHRSTLVNASFVEEIRAWPKGEYSLRVKGGKDLTVSNKYKSNLKSIAEFCIGGAALAE